MGEGWRYAREIDSHHETIKNLYYIMAQKNELSTGKGALVPIQGLGIMVRRFPALNTPTPSQSFPLGIPSSYQTESSPCQSGESESQSLPPAAR